MLYLGTTPFFTAFKDGLKEVRSLLQSDFLFAALTMATRNHRLRSDTSLDPSLAFFSFA